MVECAFVQPAGRVTVVIATADRSDELCQTLGRIMALPEAPPVIVVDNHSLDATPAAVRQGFPRARVLALPSNEGAAARTVGARLATTPYVAFCDDDSWWEPGALTVAADRLDADPDIGLLAAKVLVGPSAMVDPTSTQMAAGRLDDRLRHSPAGARGVTGFLACAAVVRRSAFLGVGGFEPHLRIGGEEELVSLDLAAGGWKLVYLPEAVVRHHPSTRRDSRCRQRLLVRNHLLTAGLRYSALTVARRTISALQAGFSRPAAWCGIADAVISAPWALPRRCVVPAQLEAVFLDDTGCQRG